MPGDFVTGSLIVCSAALLGTSGLAFGQDRVAPRLTGERATWWNRWWGANV